MKTQAEILKDALNELLTLTAFEFSVRVEVSHVGGSPTIKIVADDAEQLEGVRQFVLETLNGDRPEWATTELYEMIAQAIDETGSDDVCCEEAFGYWEQIASDTIRQYWPEEAEAVVTKKGDVWVIKGEVRD